MIKCWHKKTSTAFGSGSFFLGCNFEGVSLSRNKVLLVSVCGRFFCLLTVKDIGYAFLKDIDW